MKHRGWLLIGLATVLTTAVVWQWPSSYCWSAKVVYGLEIPQCPAGELRQVLRINGSGLTREGEGNVYVGARAVYTTGISDRTSAATLYEFDVSLSFVDQAGNETPLKPKDGWKWGNGDRWATVTLPRVPDGDHTLRARVTSTIGEDSVDLPLALYAPARIHVMTDRPLYEPGNEVKFRALALRARDLTPIDHRPGTWLVTDPNGEVLLEEKAPAGEWGVVAGSFPLDRGADTGSWNVTWRSGNDEASASFTVEPFTLPRFRVDVTPGRSFYRAGDEPSLSGGVIYSSGAPVVGAEIKLSWSVQGGWPPPTEWLSGGLPRQVTTDRNGRFTLTLPVIPNDLQGQATLVARLSAVDRAGDRVEGAASLLLSEDAVQVQAITELAGGMVASANNRLYLRVTQADGRSLSGAAIKVKRAWAADDPGIDAVLDEDSVARIQIDPGPPVNVVIPPAPFRPKPKQATRLVRLVQDDELVSGDNASVADQIELAKWLAPLEACGKWVGGSSERSNVIVRVEQSGAISASASGTSSLDRCVLRTLTGRRLSTGWQRLYVLGFQFKDPDLPKLEPDMTGPLHTPDGLTALIQDAARDSRSCLPRDFEGELSWRLSWQVAARSTRVQASWLRGRDAPAVPANVATCVRSRVTSRTLPTPADRNALGLVRYQVSQPYVSQQSRPQPTIMKGYELLVSAHIDDQEVGETRLRMTPGEIPNLRLRALPVVTKPGDEVSLTLIRGPDFEGTIPKKMRVAHVGKTDDIEIDKDTRTAKFTIPDDVKGWYEFSAAGQRALVYVQANDALAVSIAPDSERYAPGAQATLAIQTAIGGQGAPAAVGLFGVDESLGQLTTLPGPDALGSVRPQISMAEQVFGVLDAQALTLGRIRGKFASEATILRVSSIPSPPDLDVVIYSSAETKFDPVAELVDPFYIILNELHTQTRAWETSAPQAELMKPPIMAKLWNQALDACARRGERIVDAFGRRLRLHYLPEDLLSLTDPRNVVVVGTRLPEDVENWSRWVRRNQP